MMTISRYEEGMQSIKMTKESSKNATSDGISVTSVSDIISKQNSEENFQQAYN